MRPALARVSGVGRVEVFSSDEAEIQVVVDPGALLASGTHRRRRRRTRSEPQNRITPVGRYSADGLQHLVLASGLWRSEARHREDPGGREGASRRPAGDVSRRVFRGAPDRTDPRDAATAEPAAVVSVSQQVGAEHPRPAGRASRARCVELARSLPSGLRISKVYDLAGFVAEAMASVRDAILLGGLLAVAVLFVFPSLLAHHAGRRRHPAPHRRSRPSCS